ncbi:MAG: CRISPR-associated protein Csx20 [Thermodesulfobacteriota bacterium]|nr:CRISPR-associated protein Csx20 [Thermodesulfobacteriota bacterium]
MKSLTTDGLRKSLSFKKKLFSVFNHILTTEQISDARHSLGVTEFVEMPDKLKQIWKQIPADSESISRYLDPLKKWILANAAKEDIILVQGDFGATYLMVEFAFKHGLIPVYSTTYRQAAESVQPDGRLKTEHIFKHQMFRKYGS